MDRGEERKKKKYRKFKKGGPKRCQNEKHNIDPISLISNGWNIL